jgi:hypothetical protein
VYYSIITSKETKGKVFVSPKLSGKNEFANRDSILISAGGRQKTIEVSLKRDMKRNELIVSQDILEELMLPTEIKYQIKVDESGIKIGPVIGLLMAKDSNGMTKGRLKDLLNYCLIYPEVNGLILAFSIEDIDFEEKKVKGYYYSPDLEGKGIPWKEGVFPFPDSVFQRIDLPENIRVKVAEITNNRMFNSNFFNKWEFHKMISEYEVFCPHIPETSLVTSIDDVDSILSHHSAAYLKPLSGTLSRGIYRIAASKGMYEVKDKLGKLVLKDSSREEASEFINGIIHRHKYLVQQALNPIKVDDSHLDFRVIMQKDHTLIWKCTGIVAFVGSRGDICTNWGYTAGFEELLSKQFNFSQQDIYKKKQEIIQACSTACRILDLNEDNYGDLGFDVIIDQSLKVWILEANKRHYHNVALWNNDAQTYFDIKANIIKYAVALSGFEVY